MGYTSIATATSKGAIPFWMVNMCGGCHNPIIRTCTIEGEAQGINAVSGYGNASNTRDSNQNAAGQKASVNLKIGLSKGLTEIKNGTLLKHRNYNNEEIYSVLGTTAYFGVSVYSYVRRKECPYCGHIDTWIDGSPESNFKKICPVVERPQLVMSREAAVEWAKTKGIALKKLLEPQKTDMGNGQSSRMVLLDKIAGLKEELKMEQLNEQIRQTNTVYWDLKGKKISFINFSEKKKQQKEIERLDKELQRLKTLQDSERKRIDHEIHLAECELEAICQQIRGYGNGATEYTPFGTSANTTVIPNKKDNTAAAFCEV